MDRCYIKTVSGFLIGLILVLILTGCATKTKRPEVRWSDVSIQELVGHDTRRVQQELALMDYAKAVSIIGDGLRASRTGETSADLTTFSFQTSDSYTTDQPLYDGLRQYAISRQTTVTVATHNVPWENVTAIKYRKSTAGHNAVIVEYETASRNSNSLRIIRPKADARKIALAFMRMTAVNETGSIPMIQPRSPDRHLRQIFELGLLTSAAHRPREGSEAVARRLFDELRRNLYLPVVAPYDHPRFPNLVKFRIAKELGDQAQNLFELGFVLSIVNNRTFKEHERYIRELTMKSGIPVVIVEDFASEFRNANPRDFREARSVLLRRIMDFLG